VLLVCLLPCLALGKTFVVYPREARDLPIMQEDATAVLFGLDFENKVFQDEEARGAKSVNVDVEEALYEEDPRVEKSLLNTFPFNQQGDGHGQHGEHGAHGAHHGDHGVQHGEAHGAHGGQADQRRVAAAYSPGVQSPANTDSASAPLRDRLSNRVKEVVSQQVRQQLGQRPATSQAFPFRGVVSRQGEGSEGEQEEDQNAVTFNVIGAAAAADEEVKGGRKCIDKVMMVEVTEYDDVITCDHSYDKR
jgi:hypothetical protein